MNTTTQEDETTISQDIQDMFDEYSVLDMPECKKAEDGKIYQCKMLAEYEQQIVTAPSTATPINSLLFREKPINKNKKTEAPSVSIVNKTMTVENSSIYPSDKKKSEIKLNIYKTLKPNSDHPDQSFEESGHGIQPHEILIFDHYEYNYKILEIKNLRILYPSTSDISEVVPGNKPRKLALDVDHIDSKYEESLISDIINAGEQAIASLWGVNGSDPLISIRQYDEESGYHIVYDNYAVVSAETAKAWVYRTIELLPPIARSKIDIGGSLTRSGYNNFRIVGYTKYKENVAYKLDVIDGSDYNAFLLTDTRSCEILEAKVCDKSRDKTFEPIQPYSIDAFTNCVETYLKKTGEYEYFKPRPSQQGNMLKFTRQAPTNCSICNREHTSNGIYFTCDSTGNVYQGCYANVDGITERIGSFYAPGKGVESAIDSEPLLPDEIDEIKSYGVEIVEYDNARTQSYPLHVDTLLIKANKGLGKTCNLQEWLKTKYNGTSPTFITPTFRRSFCDFFSSEINKVDGFDLKDYRETKKNGSICERQLACQLESIHGVILPDKSLEILAIDEIESVLDQLQSFTMREVRPAVYNKLCFLLRTAKHVIAMDADISARTVEWINSVRGGKIVMHWNKYQTLKGKKYIMYKHEEEWQHKLNSDIREGLNIAICWTKSVKIDPDAIKAYALSQGYKPNEIMILSSIHDSGDAYKDINKAVTPVRLLIWSPSCMAGISIKKVYDKLYCKFSNGSAGVNASSQMMLRVRKFNCDDICIFASTTTNGMTIGPTTWLEYVAHNNCLIRNIANVYGKDVIGNWKYNAMGQVVFDTNDPYYRLKARTDIRANLDKLHWLKLFIDHESQAGAEFTVIDIKTGQSGLEMKAHKKLCQQVQTEHYKAIEEVKNPVKTFDELKKLRQLKKDGKDHDAYALEAGNFKNKYHIDFAEKLSPEFYSWYDHERKVDTYHTARRIRGDNGLENVLIKDEKRIRDALTGLGKQIRMLDVQTKTNYRHDKLINDTLNIIHEDWNKSDEAVCSVPVNGISGDVMREIIDSQLVPMWEKIGIDTIVATCGIRKRAIFDPSISKAGVRYRKAIAFNNAILSNFGVSINKICRKKVKGRKARDNYVFTSHVDSWFDMTLCEHKDGTLPKPLIRDVLSTCDGVITTVRQETMNMINQYI